MNPEVQVIPSVRVKHKSLGFGVTQGPRYESVSLPEYVRVDFDNGTSAGVSVEFLEDGLEPRKERLKDLVPVRTLGKNEGSDHALMLEAQADTSSEEQAESQEKSQRLDTLCVYPHGWARGEDGQLEYIGREN